MIKLILNVSMFTTTLRGHGISENSDSKGYFTFDVPTSFWMSSVSSFLNLVLSNIFH